MPMRPRIMNQAPFKTATFALITYRWMHCFFFENKFSVAKNSRPPSGIITGTANPFAGFEGGGFFSDEFDHVLDAGDFAESDVVEDGGFVEVAMGVDEAGRDGEAVEVYGLGGFGSELAEFVVSADGGDFAVVDKKGLGDGIAGVDGDDMAVEKEEVGLSVRRNGSSKK